jgi:UDP-glucose:(heptosyl)LPS alpha-1,3-glucosyltransferase
MKIAIVIEHFNPKRGGAEVYTSYLAGRLAADGHDVTVFSEDSQLEPARVNMVRVPVKGITAAGRVLSFATESAHMAAEGGFDVVHSMARILKMSVYQPHGGVMRASLERSLATTSSSLHQGLRKAARWLNTKTDMLLEIEGIIYEAKRPPRLVAISKMVAEDMKRFYSIAADKIDVVYNGVDTQRFRPENRLAARGSVRQAIHVEEDDVLLLLVAHNYRLKGVEVFIRTIAELAGAGHDRVRGLIVGNGDVRPYKGLAEKLRVCDKVIFHPGVADIERYYAAADIYLHPAFYEPMGLVVLEALASGVPVITTGFTGASEIITHGVDSFVVKDPRDIRGILEAVEALFDKRRRDEMGLAARALAEQFPLERNYRGILDVYKRAIAEGSGADLEIKRGDS